MFVRLLRQPRSSAVRTRTLSTATEFVKTDVDHDGIATVTMQYVPLNIFNFEFACSLRRTLHSVIANNPRGIILTSAYPKVFTAGLDLALIQRSNREEYKSWWFELQEIFLTLYGCHAPTVAAITGYSAGFGTLLACSCEYRIMVDSNNVQNRFLGYHEVQFGFNPPLWFLLALINVLPRRIAERAVLQGTLFNATEAMEISLIDELASSQENAIEKSKLWIQQSFPNAMIGRGVTKQLIRAEAITYLKENRQEDMEESFRLSSSKEYQSDLFAYLKSVNLKLKQSR